MPTMSRRSLSVLATMLAGSALLATIPSAAVLPREFWFHHSHVLGTSLDIAVVASEPADAERAETIILAEIERLRRILSTYDSTSEIGRLEQERSLSRCSPELIEVL